MNKTYRRVRTRFAPDVRFELDAIPFRARETTGLEQLKARLLRQLLDRTADPEENTLLRRAANDAAALAWATNYPVLLFPGLLEEKAREALLQRRRQEQVRLRSLNLLPQAA
jgi:hypothetical protein